MKFLPLVWRNLLRRKVRTIFTLASVFIAFVLYSFLMVVQNAFSMGVEVAGVDRLVLMHKVSLIQLLPISYAQKIQSTEGVTHVGYSTWFGGTYQDKANQFAVMAIDADYLQLYPEMRVPDDQMKAWRADRQGAIVGKATAEKYGWKIGDKIPVQATIWIPKQGNTWFFNVDAIYDADKGVDTSSFFFHYEYLDENRRGAYGMVGWYVLRIDDPSHAADVASRLDAQFANSSAETKTSTEKAFLQGFVNQVGNIKAIIVSILAAVLFTLFLLVLANTMAQSVRERTSELAVLKTLGFSNGLVLGLVLAESMFLALLGGGLGLAITYFAVEGGSFNNAFLPVFIMRSRDIVIGIVLCCALGIVAGALPATTAMRLRITDALRRT
ncbi:MAG TPA: FtsX-like permease family protein [Vicinamibacterales bacterium]|jgi:putative ABC transport system permease protein|nr:FtsX-like permease family protein [Vicinamibacterales bacterium]